MTERRIRALRGATSVGVNDAGAIVDAAAELLEEIVQANGIELEDIVSIVFTTTADLNAAFPAEGARRAGLGGVPLLCAAEIDVPEALPHCIRVLMHLYSERDYASLQHVYLGEARRLRTDLPG